MEQALAYVCCSAEESRVKVQKYCRKIYELGMYQSVRDLYSHHSWKSPMQKICRDMEECHISFYGDAGW